jgi:hypothetical protein
MDNSNDSFLSELLSEFRQKFPLLFNQFFQLGFNSIKLSFFVTDKIS